MELARLIANRRWLRCDHPFPHLRATEVFTPAVYQGLEAAFQEVLARGFGTPAEGDRFARGIDGYDVYALPFHAGLPQPLHLFFSQPWHDLLAHLLGVHATGDLNGALHHHLPKSLSGRPHNDLNPGWFLSGAQPGVVNLSDNLRCSYYTGHTGAGGPPAHESVRAVACLFYLNNPPWRPGLGGETGLYASPHTRTEEPLVAVPPINNSLLVFECTGRSYHAFLRNPVQPRSSVILWLHRTKTEALAHFGPGAIVGWDGPRVLNEPPPSR